jgi:hypothetical protein
MLSAIAILIGIVTFYIKLTKDSEIAAYRETIAYIDRHSEKLWEQWSSIESGSNDEKLIKSFLNRLEQMSLLVNKKAFDNDLVYNSFWMLYCQPLEYPNVSNLYERLRANDNHVFAEYKALSELWAPRIQKEQAPNIHAPN